jgi:hypothetical protein
MFEAAANAANDISPHDGEEMAAAIAAIRSYARSNDKAQSFDHQHGRLHGAGAE